MVCGRANSTPEEWSASLREPGAEPRIRRGPDLRDPESSTGGLDRARVVHRRRRPTGAGRRGDARARRRCPSCATAAPTRPCARSPSSWSCSLLLAWRARPPRGRGRRAAGSGSGRRVAAGARARRSSPAFDPPDAPYGAGPPRRRPARLARPGGARRPAGHGLLRRAARRARRGGGRPRRRPAPPTSRSTATRRASATPVARRRPRSAPCRCAGSHCFPRACLHWGWIEGATTYLDPLRLVGAGPVRLLPLWRDLPAGAGLARRPSTPELRADARAGAAARPARRVGRAGSSGARVGLLVGAAQPVGGDVGVALGRGQRGVPEQLLHRAQVGAALEQVGRGACAAGRAGRCRGRPGTSAIRRCTRVRTARWSIRPPAGAEEQRGAGALGDQRRAALRAPRSRARARPGARTAPMRSLRPLPSTRTTLRSRSTSSTSRPTSSPTRMPVA